MRLLRQLGQFEFGSWWEAGLSLFYPEVCQLCGEHRAGPAEGFVCGRCWRRVRFVKPPYCRRCGLPFSGEMSEPFECSNCHEIRLHFSRARSAVIANELMLEVIHRYKYQRALWFETFLTDLLSRYFTGSEAEPPAWDLIVPVPLHPTKLREREFNQSERLARQLGLHLGLPVSRDIVKRIAPTRTQTMLSRKARADNVRNAFAPRAGVELNGARVLLVDDVLTTGATTSSCAKALNNAGAAEVDVWTLARGM